MWTIGFSKSGLAPEFKPYQRDTFYAAREVLADILDEAASCAVEAGEIIEASLLKRAQAQLETSGFSFPREVDFNVGQYRYWIVCRL